MSWLWDSCCQTSRSFRQALSVTAFFEHHPECILDGMRPKEAFRDNTNNPDCYRREDLDEDWNITLPKPFFHLPRRLKPEDESELVSWSVRHTKR